MEPDGAENSIPQSGKRNTFSTRMRCRCLENQADTIAPLLAWGVQSSLIRSVSYRTDANESAQCGIGAVIASCKRKEVILWQLPPFPFQGSLAARP